MFKIEIIRPMNTVGAGYGSYPTQKRLGAALKKLPTENVLRENDLVLIHQDEKILEFWFVSAEGIDGYHGPLQGVDFIYYENYRNAWNTFWLGTFGERFDSMLHVVGFIFAEKELYIKLVFGLYQKLEGEPRMPASKELYQELVNFSESEAPNALRFSATANQIMKKHKGFSSREYEILCSLVMSIYDEDDFLTFCLDIQHESIADKIRELLPLRDLITLVAKHSSRL